MFPLAVEKLHSERVFSDVMSPLFVTVVIFSLSTSPSVTSPDTV